MSLRSKLATGFLAASLSLGGGLAVAQDATPAGSPAASPAVKVYIGSAEGAIIGYADLSEGEDGVTIHVYSTADSGLEAGDHGLHIHAYGYCDASVGFSTAGGHFNPTDKPHGDGPSADVHAGDLGNLTVNEDGTYDMTVTSPYITLKEGEPNSLMSENGSSLMIHADRDDLMTDPSGNSGARVGCGVISRVADPSLLPPATPVASPAATPEATPAS